MSVRFTTIAGISVGDTVKINAGYVYPGYLEMAKNLGADLKFWVQNRSITPISKGLYSNNDETGKVLNIIYNNETYYVLVRLTGKNQEYVISYDGLTRIDPVSIILPDSMFEL